MGNGFVFEETEDLGEGVDNAEAGDVTGIAQTLF